MTEQNEAWEGTAQIGNDAAENNGNRTFNGFIDDVAVFNQTLAASRIEVYYQAARTGGITINNGAIAPGDLRFTSITGWRDKAVLQWIGGGFLEEAPTPVGPWSKSPKQENPQTVSGPGTRFYRLSR